LDHSGANGHLSVIDGAYCNPELRSRALLVRGKRMLSIVSNAVIAFSYLSLTYQLYQVNCSIEVRVECWLLLVIHCLN
jgi:hypothetical protein